MLTGLELASNGEKLPVILDSSLGGSARHLRDFSEIPLLVLMM